MAITRLAAFVSFAMRGVAFGVASIAVVSSTALARTPTPTAVPTRTDGPSPTVTRTGSPTPTGTLPRPEVHVTVSPNPARSGQLVTLDASANGQSAVYQWSQVGGFPVVQIDFVHQAVAHFAVPVVAQVTVITVEVLVSGYNSGPARAEITLLPADAIVAQVGSGGAVPGTKLRIDVTLRPNGLLVTRVEHEIDFGPYAVVADRGGGIPDCEPGAALSPTSASFVFLPHGCAATKSCSGVHASLATHDPIPENGVAYRCMVAVSDKVSPPDEGCSHALHCALGTARSTSGIPLRILCPDGSDGDVVANYALGRPQFLFAAQPSAPVVGDAVQVMFTVLGDGGLPHYSLLGADPIFSGMLSAASGGQLGTVSFDLHANCPGTAPLRLNVNYETLFGCPGHTFYSFTSQTSPIFPLVVRDSVTPIPTPTPPATPLPTCAATGTPYCADQCVPCPTIRAGCLAVGCGFCIQNPTCADGEVCDPHSGGPPYGCCACVTPTPTPTPPATPTCAATGTPYCASQCVPCPTIREGCLARGCGYCIENPTCADGEVCDPRGGGPPYECCTCVTPTPQRTDGPSPTPPDVAGIVISGLVYDASIGFDAPIAGAEVGFRYGLSGASGSVRTDAAGRYRLELPSGVTEVELSFAADGFFQFTGGYTVADLGPSLDIGLDPDGCASASAITIVPDTGPPGTTVDVSGQCYFIHSGREATIYFDLEAVATVRGDTPGSYHTTFTVPATASEGPHMVSLRAGPSVYGAVTFHVLPSCIGDCVCSGDCDGDGVVHVDELIRMVNIVLDGNTHAGSCPRIAQWCPGLDVAISCLVGAVKHALEGCPVGAGAGTWESTVPRSTTVTGIAVDPTYSQTNSA